MRECKRFPGLHLIQTDDCYTFRYGAVDVTYQITDQGARIIDFSERGHFSREMERYIKAWCEARAQEKRAAAATATQQNPLSRAS